MGINGNPPNCARAAFADIAPAIVIKATKPVSRVALGLSVIGFKAVPIVLSMPVKVLFLLVITSSMQCNADIVFLYK